MTRKYFITRYTSFVKFVLKLLQLVKERGIESNEILSNMITHEKDRQMRVYKTIQKRAVLGLQAGESNLVLYKALSSLTGLPLKEEHQIELELLSE